MVFDKILLQFFGDLLYYRGTINGATLDAIYEAKDVFDLDDIIADVANKSRSTDSYIRGE